MKIYIVRHGETTANKEGLLQGWLDRPLTKEGIRLTKITGQGLKDIHFNVAFTSPLKRAKDTAKIILKENNFPTTPVIEDERIKEINMGEWEGKPFKGKDSPLNPKEVELFFGNPFKLDRFPNGESTLDVCKRTQDFIRELVKEDKYENVLVTTHGFALRALLNFLYEDKSDFWQGHVPYNCACNIIEYKNGQFTFISKDKIYYDKKDTIDRYKI